MSRLTNTLCFQYFQRRIKTYLFPHCLLQRISCSSIRGVAANVWHWTLRPNNGSVSPPLLTEPDHLNLFRGYSLQCINMDTFSSLKLRNPRNRCQHWRKHKWSGSGAVGGDCFGCKSWICWLRAIWMTATGFHCDIDAVALRKAPQSIDGINYQNCICTNITVDLLWSNTVWCLIPWWLLLFGIST